MSLLSMLSKNVHCQISDTKSFINVKSCLLLSLATCKRSILDKIDQIPMLLLNLFDLFLAFIHFLLQHLNLFVLLLFPLNYFLFALLVHLILLLKHYILLLDFPQQFFLYRLKSLQLYYFHCSDMLYLNTLRILLS